MLLILTLLLASLGVNVWTLYKISDIECHTEAIRFLLATILMEEEDDDPDG